MTNESDPGTQGVDLAYYRQISVEYFLWVLNFENLYFFGYCLLVTAAVFFGLLKKCCISKCCIFSKVFFWVQFYSLGTSINTVLHYYHIVLNFYQMNNVLGGYSLGLHFSVDIFWGFLSLTKNFLGPISV